ncbi:MAG: type II toxin-antitoxin system VapC family toxin [Sulfuritalea sp.]|nr:type II toxin-antitoxin system VapC family toxin [Sulfuritalea sp.]
MILFCDTSALVKLYVREDGTDRVLREVEAASIVAVCRIAWAETMAAFARRARETNDLTQKSPPRGALPSRGRNTRGGPSRFEDAALIEEIRRRLHKDWEDYAIVEITQPLVERAGDYADTFALRAYDSVQLAAAATLQAAVGAPVRFACFDQRLQKAAKILGLLPV